MSNEWKQRPSRKDISPAKLKWFDKCPYAFKLKYIEKIEPVYFDPNVFKVGSIVHDTIHEYYMVRPAIDAAREYILSVLYRKWDYSLEYSKFADAIQYIKHFIDFELIRRKNEDVFPASEVEISRNGYYGIIDFLMEDRKLVIDFKTGKKPRERKSYSFQAVVYNWLSCADDEVFFYYLGPNEIIGIKVTQELIDEVLQLSKGIQDAFIKREFPALGSCSGCEYKHCCSKVH